MAKARPIKPELLRDPDLKVAEREMGLGWFALRGLLIGLIDHADGNGVFPWKMTYLRETIFPGEDFPFVEYLEALERGQWVRRFRDQFGDEYGVIRTFFVHQRDATKDATWCPTPPRDAISPKAQEAYDELEAAGILQRRQGGRPKKGKPRGTNRDRSRSIQIDPSPDHPLHPVDPVDPVDPARPRPPLPLREKTTSAPPPAPRPDDDDDEHGTGEEREHWTQDQFVKAYLDLYGQPPRPNWLRMFGPEYLRLPARVLADAFRRATNSEMAIRAPSYLGKCIETAIEEDRRRSTPPPPESQAAADGWWTEAPTCKACRGTGVVDADLTPCEGCAGHGRLLTPEQAAEIESRYQEGAR